MRKYEEEKEKMKKRKMENDKMYVKNEKGTVENERAKMKTMGRAGCCDSSVATGVAPV